MPHVADVPGTQAAVWQNSAALETSPEQQTGARKDPATPALVPASVWTSPGGRAEQRRAASPGGAAWLSGTCPSPSVAASRARSGAGSAPGPFLRPAGAASPPDLSMSGAEAPDTQDPEGAGTCPNDVPSLKEIEQLLNTGRPSCNHVDEVWPNLFLGDL